MEESNSSDTVPQEKHISQANPKDKKEGSALSHCLHLYPEHSASLRFLSYHTAPSCKWN